MGDELERRESPPAVGEPTARDVVRTAVDALRAVGCPVPSAHCAILGKHAKALLADDFDFEIVSLAAVVALKRGQPQHLQYIASDIVMARHGQRMSRREYEKALQDEVELGRH